MNGEKSMPAACAREGEPCALRLRERHPRDIEFGIIYGGIAVLILISLRFTPVARLLPGCVFKELTSFPCPTCGATRAVLLLAHGEAAASLSMNPLVSFCFVGACLVFAFSLLAFLLHLPRPSVELSPREHTAIRVVVVVLVLMNWSYLAGSLISG
jgi:hypothetical protein